MGFGGERTEKSKGQLRPPAWIKRDGSQDSGASGGDARWDIGSDFRRVGSEASAEFGRLGWSSAEVSEPRVPRLLAPAFLLHAEEHILEKPEEEEKGGGRKTEEEEEEKEEGKGSIRSNSSGSSRSVPQVAATVTSTQILNTDSISICQLIRFAVKSLFRSRPPAHLVQQHSRLWVSLLPCSPPTHNLHPQSSRGDFQDDTFVRPCVPLRGSSKGCLDSKVLRSQVSGLSIAQALLFPPVSRYSSSTSLTSLPGHAKLHPQYLTTPGHDRVLLPNRSTLTPLLSLLQHHLPLEAFPHHLI
ncbi:hypothetical protein H920_11517 [Fukomys damarensis]|uniref:Uncharacterized protein n=1 Tax=Fukomys damarensis TaxID=885580 RepID=A0A091D7R5_FUKDA|nr:hypothetical protein H920_11517 [Fukomys damarensis]